MARIEISEPAHYPFSTELEVYIGQVNRGNHLGNDAVVSLLNEARLRFMAFLELPTFNNPAINFINADLAVIYKGEGHHGDRLRIQVAAQERSKYGCDFVYRVSNAKTGQTLAIAKTAMLTYDYEQGRLAEPPAEFWQALDTAEKRNNC